MIATTKRLSIFLETIMLDDLKEDDDEELNGDHEYVRVLRQVQDKWFPGDHRYRVRTVKGDNHQSVENAVTMAKTAGIFPRPST